MVPEASLRQLLWVFRLLEFCADGGEDLWEVGGGGGVGCWAVPGDVVFLRVLGVPLWFRPGIVGPRFLGPLPV